MFPNSRRALGRQGSSTALFSALLLSWELIGIEVPEAPLSAVKVSLKSPELLPFVLTALVGYFGLRTMLEWYQCDRQRRETLAVRIDLGLAHTLGFGAVLLFVTQAILRQQLFTRLSKEQLLLLLGTATLSLIVFWPANKLSFYRFLFRFSCFLLTGLLIAINLHSSAVPIAGVVAGVATSFAIRLLLAPGWIFRFVANAFFATIRIRAIEGAANLDRLLAERQRVILWYWHERSFFIWFSLATTLIKKGYPLTHVFSWSRDSTVVTDLLQGRNWKILFTDSMNSGTFTDFDWSEGGLVVAADGPRGPRHVVKEAVVEAAKSQDVPIIAVTWVAKGEWRLRSWDQFVVPKPLTTTILAVSQPVLLSEELKGKEEGHSVEVAMTKQMADLER